MPTPLTDADKVLRNDTGKDIVEKLDDIAQALGVGVNADQINYDNTESGLTADNAQDAIDEIKDITDDLDEKIDDKTSYESTASGSIATFSDGGDNIPMKSCEVAIVAQQASGTPSPSNPRAITGFSSISVPVVGGKNLFGGSDGVNYPLIIPANKTFTLSCSAGGGKFEYFRKDGTLIDYYFFGYNQSRTITCPETIYSVTLTTVNTPYQNAQIEFANSPTTYEAFKANNITPVSLGQTIYGGTAELVGGNGTKTYGIVDLSTLNWIYNSANQVFYSPNDFGEYRGTGKIGLCEIYTVVDNVSRVSDVPATDNIICGYRDSETHRLYIRNTAYTDETAFKNSMTGKYLVYKLATPTAFTFTGANIPTLSGVNNVYADSGDVNELEYFNKNTDEIADAIRSETTNKMDKANPTGTGSLSLNRKANTTVGTNSVAEGSNCSAIGTAAHAEGINTTASGGAHAEGGATTASGTYAHAEGGATTASGENSHSEGDSTTASGKNSHSEGSDTIASGSASHAEGKATKANRRSQHVFGEYNVEETGNVTTKGTYVEIVGNGTGNAARSNARTLDWSGNEVLAGGLKINGNQDVLPSVTLEYLEASTTKTYEIPTSIRNNGGIYILAFNSSYGVGGVYLLFAKSSSSSISFVPLQASGYIVLTSVSNYQFSVQSGNASFTPMITRIA